MRRCAIAVLAGLALGCSSGGAGPEEPLAPGDHVRTIESGGRTRTYELHVPPVAVGVQPLPLVLAFHGLFGSAAQTRAISGLDALADARGFAVAYPETAFGDWANGCGACGSLAENLGIDDVAFVRQVLAATQAELPIDADRVYAAGISNGALFVHRLACDAADRIAGFASVAATALAPEEIPPCAPTRRRPIVFIHGTADPLFPPGGMTIGRVATLSIEATVAAWSSRNGCAGSATTALPDRAPDGTTARRVDHQSCAEDVVLYQIEGGGHIWPGSTGPSDVDASAAITEFFLAQP